MAGTSIDPLVGITFPDNTIQTTAASKFGPGTWQSYNSSSRTTGTIYTNSTGKPIALSIARFGGNGSTTSIFVAGNVAASQGVDQYGGSELMTVFVPDGATYQVNNNYGTYSGWWELR